MSAVLSAPYRLIRRMEESDLVLVMEIEAAAYEFPWTLKIFRDCLRVGYRAWILEQDNKLVGYGLITVGAGESHILNLCVHPAYHRCGCGRCLLEHLLANAKQQGADTLFLEVRESNYAAYQLYTQLGFNQVGTRRGYYPASNNEREDAIILALVL